MRVLIRLEHARSIGALLIGIGVVCLVIALVAGSAVLLGLALLSLLFGGFIFFVYSVVSNAIREYETEMHERILSMMKKYDRELCEKFILKEEQV